MPRKVTLARIPLFDFDLVRLCDALRAVNLLSDRENVCLVITLEDLIDCVQIFNVESIELEKDYPLDIDGVTDTALSQPALFFEVFIAAIQGD